VLNPTQTAARHDAIVAYVRRYRAEFHVGPTYAEIAVMVGYASPAAARKAVLVLCGAGRLARVNNSIARSLRVPDGE
jgi:hypothetical protein